jgi:hypothetical protein
MAKAPVSSDAFSELLSTAIADSTLRETPVVVKNVPSVAVRTPTTPTTREASPPSVSIVKPGSEPEEVKKSEEIPARKPDQSDSIRSVKGKSFKILEQIDATGIQLVFTDQAVSGISDTISVWIPRAPAAAPPARPSSIDTPHSATKTSADSVATSTPDRTDCKGFVSVKDLGMLRRRMETLVDEDAKVALALKSFREVCFNTEQVRSLLVVFGREEGRFKLLDVAYAYVADPSVFSELESVLKDPYFIYRFRKKTSQAPAR